MSDTPLIMRPDSREYKERAEAKARQRAMSDAMKAIPKNPELAALLEAAASGPPMTPDELFEQKVSFVYGQMMDSNPDITKEKVRKRLEASR